MDRGMIFDTVHGAFVDGPGIRTTVFFKGCTLRCAWCHNPESQSRMPQMLVFPDKCTDCGRCRQVCPQAPGHCTLCGECVLSCPAAARQLCGSIRTVDDVWAEIIRDKAFYQASGGGVTFSGGECMLQPDFLLALLKQCKANGIHTAVDTAGHVPFADFAKILPYTDLFLYDVKLLDTAKHKAYTGVGNERILDNLKKLFAAGAAIWIRIPVISGVNDSAEEMRQLNAFLRSCGKPERIELLPYHAMGENKYRAAGREPPRFRAPDAETMQLVKENFA